MKRSTALLSVGLVFVLGVLVGAFGTRLAVRRAAPPGPPWERGFPMLRHDLERRLDLTEEQSRQVGEILRRNFREMEELRRQLRPEMEERLGRMRGEIEAVLTPEQLEEFQARHDWRGGPLRPRRGPPGRERRPRGPGRDDG